MDIFDHIKIAYSSLVSNKFRTFLTTLGIIIGVMAVVSLLGIGQGAQASIEDSFDAFGSDNIFAIPGNQEDSFGPPNLSDSFTEEQMQDFIDFPKRYIETASAQTFSGKEIQSDTTNKSTQVLGMLGDYELVFNLEVEKGRALNERDFDTASKVILFGPDLADDLFPNSDALGQEVRIDGTSFTVVGILEAKGSTGFETPDEYAYMAFPAYKKYLVGRDQLSQLGIRAIDINLIEEAKVEAEGILRRVRDLDDDQKNDFTIRDSGEILERINEFTGILTGFLASIAAISLLVGGIGVMNIMFVSITERTKEIGLRKSIGATNRDILIQFLTESILVSLVGGVFGLIVGNLISYAVSTSLDLGTGIYLDGILLGIGFSVFIGATFGLYPAFKASKLNPIEALRYE